MYKFLFTSIFILISSLLFSQVNADKGNQVVKEIKDSTEVKKFYELSLSNEFVSPRPEAAKHKPIKMINPETFVLINGMKIILVQNSKLPFVSVNVQFDYSDVLLNEQKGVDLIFSKLWGKSGKKHNEESIRAYKSRTGSVVDIHKKSIYIEGLEKYKEKNIELISDLALQFSFSDDDFEDVKEEVVDSMYFASNRNEFIVDAVARKLMFGDNNPAGEVFNIDNIENITADDVRNYYKTFFNPSNCYLMVYGDISMRDLRKLVIKNFSKYRKGNVIKGYYPQPYNLPQIEIDYIENYNSDSLCVWIGNVITQKDEDVSWMLEKSSSTLLFDKEIGLFSAQVLKDMGMKNLKAEFDDDGKYFALEYDVSEKDISKAVTKSVELLSKVNTDRLIDSIGFEIYKDKMIQDYIEGLSQPRKLSHFYMMYYITGLGRYIVPNLMEVIDTITIPTINEFTAYKFKPNQLRIVVSGKPKVAVPLLEKLGYKINYYDQFAKVTFPPALDRPVPDSVNVNDVVSRYIKNIGGENKLKSVKKLMQWWVLDINKTKLYVKNKYMLPNKRLSTYSNKEVVVLKSVFNGEYGYVEQSGSITDLDGDDFLKLSLEKSIFPVMYYPDQGYVLSLESKIPLKGEMCYKVRAEAPYGQVFLLYFRIEDGFLIRKEVLDLKTEEVVNFFNYNDFKVYNDITFPYKTETIIGGRKAELTLTQIKINDKYTRKSDFE